MKYVKVILRLLLACVVGAAILVAALAIEHFSSVSLPTPTGTFAVGRTLFDWADTHPPTPPTTPRELLVWVWYPTVKQPGAAYDSYFPAVLRKPPPPPPPDESTLLTRDISRVRGHSFANGAVSPLRPSYPVAIIGAGATAPILSYSTIAEDLASHGYVVVGFDSAYRTRFVEFPDGRVILEAPQNNPELASEKDFPTIGDRLTEAAVADTTFLLDQLEQLNRSKGSPFAGRLDLTRVGVFGHSLGGSTALQFCQQDARCKAGIDIDGRPAGAVVQTGLQKPFMFVLSDHSGDPNPATRQSTAKVRSIYERLPANERAYAVIRGANHVNFSEYGTVRMSELVAAAHRVIERRGISGRRQLEITAGYVHTFFDRYL